MEEARKSERGGFKHDEKEREKCDECVLKEDVVTCKLPYSFLVAE